MTEAEHHVALFDSLPSAIRDELEPQFISERYAAGEVILREGDAPERFYLVVRGQVEVWKTRRRAANATPVPPPGELWRVDDKQQMLVARLGTGTSFGEMALVNSAPRSATVVAATDVELRSLDAESFARVVAADASLALGLDKDGPSPGVAIARAKLTVRWSTAAAFTVAGAANDVGHLRGGRGRYPRGRCSRWLLRHLFRAS